ncbi:MAG: DUF1800 domain-containing protein [Bacteroidia bacterium]|nr:DUF1800 domain-containing protein [Bacteroidia bacterium]
MASISRKNFLSLISEEVIDKEPLIKDYPFKDPSNKDLPRHLQKTSSGIGAYSGPWGETQIIHLLRRTLFGFSKDDLTFFKGKNLTECVQLLLDVSSVQPAPPVNNYGNNANQNDPAVPYGETWVNAAINPNLEGARINSFKSWWLGLMVNQERNIREKMTLFWHHHFATEALVVQDSRFIYKHNALLRSMCLGNFKDFVKQITLDPAMLVYLNGNQNTKTAPDENYARELQELFTIGKGLAIHYTESDVKEAARVLTGWRTNRTGIGSFFDSTKHDTGNKTFSSFYNNYVITGKSGSNAGNIELDDLLQMIFNHTEVSKHIVRKIYRFFVYYVIDENVEKNVIEPLALLFRNNNYNIKIVMETLLKSEHFYDVLNNGCMIKNPIDHLVGLSRQTKLVFPNSSNPQTQYAHWQYAMQYAAILSMHIGDPPAVAGWPPYYQNPQYYELWINSDSLPKRNLACDSLLYTGYTRFGFKLMIDVLSFAQNLTNPANPNDLLNEIIKLIYPSDLSSETKTFIKNSILLSGQTGDYIWTDSWNAYVANPDNVMTKDAVKVRLQALLKYLMGQAEYQLH